MISRANFEKLEEIIKQEDFSSILSGLQRLALEPTVNKKLDNRGLNTVQLEDIAEELLLTCRKVKQFEGG